jgi:predicted nucleotidyltransferase
MLLNTLYEKKLISPPKFLPSNTHYLVMMGSQAYGCSTEDSDRDIFGWCIPHKEDIFPHLKGEIPGFGRQVNRFDVWQQHHIKDKESGNEYDFQVYSIVKFFSLCMENNPNMVDILFVPERCVLHCTKIAAMVRNEKKIFLHKGAFHKFKGYAYSQLHKMGTKQRPEQPENIKKLLAKINIKDLALLKEEKLKRGL